MRPHGSGAKVLGGGPLRLTLHTLIYEAAVADPSHLDVVLVADIFRCEASLLVGVSLYVTNSSKIF